MGTTVFIDLLGRSESRHVSVLRRNDFCTILILFGILNLAMTTRSGRTIKPVDRLISGGKNDKSVKHPLLPVPKKNSKQLEKNDTVILPNKNGKGKSRQNIQEPESPPKKPKRETVKRPTKKPEIKKVTAKTSSKFDCKTKRKRASPVKKSKANAAMPENVSTMPFIVDESIPIKVLFMNMDFL